MTYISDLDASSQVRGTKTAAQRAIGLFEVHREFNIETINAGLYFGEEHSAFTANFIVALATKNFTVLSGLSGSGKTMLSTTFGQWLGREQLLVQPVRPDWVSPEALLGYEDRQSESHDSQHGWHVPRTCEFILKAARDPQRPYLLVLDEMNLAHVEQYFADVLSGMESNQPMVPNLLRDARGWRMPSRDTDYLPWPKNLFTVGTINVDETTYSFSPKVLDRSSILEFRVTPDAICLDYPKRGEIRRADPKFSNAFLERALGDEIQWAGRKDIGMVLKKIHEMLYRHHVEFGHRVVRESLRSASMMYEIGFTDRQTIIDQILVQRILPNIERPGVATLPLIWDLTAFAVYGPHANGPIDPLQVDEAASLLPNTMRRLQRLAVRLSAG